MPSIEQRKASLEGVRNVMLNMKKNQDLRGVDQLKKRIAIRATNNTWRQMSGAKLFMHEVNHSGNKPFVIGAAYVAIGSSVIRLVFKFTWSFFVVFRFSRLAFLLLSR